MEDPGLKIVGVEAFQRLSQFVLDDTREGSLSEQERERNGHDREYQRWGKPETNVWGQGAEHAASSRANKIWTIRLGDGLGV
jgi:hypothetical protein